jgi:hypothetical protein
LAKLLTQNIFTENAYDSFQNAVFDALENRDIEKLIQVFNRLLASIPYDDYTQAIQQSMMFTDFKFPLQEWLYRTAILSLLHGCGVMVIAESHTNLGRADLIVSYCDVTWVIEIKVDYEGNSPAKKAEEALKQIDDNNYAKPYVQPVCVGLAIDDAVRQITDWRMKHELT